MRWATGSLLGQGDAEVGSHGAAQPLPVADQERLIETQAPRQRLALLGGDVHAHQRARPPGARFTSKNVIALTRRSTITPCVAR